MTALTIQLAREVVQRACDAANVVLIPPGAPSLLRTTARVSAAAMTPLTLDQVEQRASIYVPEMLTSLVRHLPDNLLKVFPVDVRGAIVLADPVWNDPVDLIDAVAHDLGHRAQEIAAGRTLGIVGVVAHGAAYLLCDLSEANAEATCRVADITARVTLEGADPAAYCEGAIVAMRELYGLDEHALGHAKRVLLSAAASLACGVLHGSGTPIEGMLRDLATWTTFPADTADVLAAGVEAEAGGRSLGELEAERDEALAAILLALRASSKGR